MRPETRATYEERILRAQSYLNARLDEDLHLEDLARIACLSPFHFHRVFRGMTGETVGAFVRRLRLQQAASQLKSSGRPVTDIAFDAGYVSLEGFSRAFHDHYGSAPSAWRENQERRTPDATPRDVRIVHRAASEVAFIRQSGPYGSIGPVFGRLFEWAGRHGLLRGPVEAVGIPYDDPDVTPPDRIRCDAALILQKPVQVTGEVKLMGLPERDYAVLRHTGPYERLSDAYAWLCGVWLPRSGREAASAPPLEFYRNYPPQTPPKLLITDIHLPLEPA